MASPFHIFRKNQKLFMALAAIMAIFVFVFADMVTSQLQKSTSGGQGSPSATVVTWDGGSLTGRELEILRQRRYFISNFLGALYTQGARTILNEGGTPLDPSVPSFVFQQENANPRTVMLGTIETRIIAQIADKAGMTVSDEMINHYLREFGLRKVTDPQIAQILQKTNRADVGHSEKQLFAGLRELLLQNYYMRSYASAVQNVMPEQRWDDWQQINRRIALEAAIVPAENFLAEVPEPTDAQLQELYDEFKDQVGNLPQSVAGVQLTSPDPGFREPQRVRLQFLLGDVNEWTEKLLDTITDEEISDYYERNKRTQFVKVDLFSGESAPEEDTAEETEEETTETKEETTEEPADDESSRIQRANPFRLAALQEEPAEEVATEEETPKDDSEDDGDGEDNDEEPVEYEPLEEVRDEIRRHLANDKAVVELDQIMGRAYAELQSEYNRYGGELIRAKSEKREAPAPPAKLANLDSAAAQLGVIHEETALLSYPELLDTFLGKATDAQTSRIPVAYAAFVKSQMELYEPFLAQDLDGHWYLAVKVEDIESSVPSLEEVRDRVVAAWKRREAAKLALERSEELAKEAQESGETLVGFFADKHFEVITTDLFSRLTFGTTPMEMRRGARLGEAPPLASVDLDFMDQAFDLEAEQVAAALNHDQTNAYVIRLDRREKTEEELRQLFLLEANDWFGGQIMRRARLQSTQRILRGQLTQRAGLDLTKLEEYLKPDRQQ
ncbi:MAG: hypothetical protein GXP28_08620 [Planctomycetes bacterium]|nr:hypothetical protein [Planctomycetota bacterium]